MSDRLAPKSRPQNSGVALDSLLAVLKDPSLVSELVKNPDLWAEVRHLSEVHRLAGVLAHSTSAFLPAGERTWRDRVLMTHHGRHARFTSLLRTLVQTFDSGGLRSVVLKGPVLAERFHAVPWLKFSHDLDLLVRVSDIPAAARIMDGLGFRMRGDFPWNLQRNYGHHLNFHAPGDELEVEVHYSFKAGAHLFPAEDFLERSVPWHSPAGFDCQVLAPADEVFYLIIHAAGHAFQRLRWLYDALAAAKTLDESARARVRSLAIERGLTGYFVAADMACREFFGEPLPLDLAGFRTPWLWSPLQPGHLRIMAQRNDYSFGIRTLDVCRMSGSPASALRLCLENGSGKWPTWIYRLRGGSVGPEVLARSLRSL